MGIDLASTEFFFCGCSPLEPMPVGLNGDIIPPTRAPWMAPAEQGMVGPTAWQPPWQKNLCVSC
jgi:hypothetical protein